MHLVTEQGMLPLYFHPDADVSMQILKSLYNAGMRVVEYTNRGDTAVNNFLQLRKVSRQRIARITVRGWYNQE